MGASPIFPSVTKGNFLMSFSPDIVLNVKAPHNRNVVFWPDGNTELRSAIVTKVGQNNDPVLAASGEIPGHQIQIDTKNREVHIVDRMGFRENAGKCEALRKLAATEQYNWKVGRLEVQKPIEKNVSEDQWPTWLWHLRRLYDHGRLERVKGKLPVYDDILVLGQVFTGDSCDITPKDPSRPHNVLDSRDIGRFKPVRD